MQAMNDQTDLPLTPPANSPQRSFIVRCWFADAAKTRPHFVALDVSSGEQRHFVELDLLLDFLGQEITNTHKRGTTHV
jgi:hypothetical protein